jgi:hypothetical protein
MNEPKPITRWSAMPRRDCKTKECNRVEYRGGWCRSCWVVERARLVFGRRVVRCSR